MRTVIIDTICFISYWVALCSSCAPYRTFRKIMSTHGICRWINKPLSERALMENKNFFYSLSLYSCCCRRCRCCLTWLSVGWLFGYSTRSIGRCVPTLLENKHDIKVLRVRIAYTNTYAVRYTMLRCFCSFAPLCLTLLSAIHGSLFYIYLKSLRCRRRRLNRRR